MKLRIVLAFVNTSLVWILCLIFAWFRWETRFTEKFSGVDLALMPVGLAAGLVVGRVTGRSRFRALTELAPQLAGRTVWSEKKFLYRSESGRKALETEKNSYGVLFYSFLAALFLTKFNLMEVGTASSFVLGVWVAGQTVPYFRLWLWQRSSRSKAACGTPGEAALLVVDSLKERESELLGRQESIRTRKRFDPRPRIVMLLVTFISYPVITWVIWTPGRAEILWVAMTLMALAAGLATGAVIGRWRLLGLQEVSTQLSGWILFQEPHALRDSRTGRRAIRTEMAVLGFASLMLILWVLLAPPSLLLPFETVASLLFGAWLTGQIVPYVRFWMNERRNFGSVTSFV